MKDKTKLIICVIGIAIIFSFLVWCAIITSSNQDEEQDEEQEKIADNYEFMSYNYSVIAKDNILDYRNATDFYDRFLYETIDNITFSFINNEAFDIKLIVGINLPSDIYNRATVWMCPEGEPEYKQKLERNIGVFGGNEHSKIYLYPGVTKNITIMVYMPATSVGAIRDNHTYTGIMSRMKCFCSDIDSYGGCQSYYFRVIPFEVKT